MTLYRQTHRLSTCLRHPTKPITGFCAPCLSERLAGLDSAAAAAHPQPPTRNPHSGSELRRSKSCSGQRPESSSANAPDPTRRKSCDVRARNTLSELFNIDDDRKGLPRKFEVELRGEEEKNDSGDEARVLDSDAEFKTMKELIDLEWERKKGAGRDLKEIAGTFWGTASVLSKKVRQWRRKQKTKKAENEGFVCQKRRETQSEVGEYALGRRSCDTDPVPGRMSLDEPRASWDGYLGPRAHHPRLTPMVSVVEESLERSPGGSAQTKDYYCSQRRRSFDRSAAEVDELKLVTNARVSPATTELFYGAKLLITEKELMGSGSKLKSVEDECEEEEEEEEGGVGVGVEAVCKNAAVESTNGVDHQKPNRRHKKWSFWGLMQRRSEKKCVDEDNADSWQKLRRVANGEANSGSVSQKLIRSYSVSCRNSCKMVDLFSNVNDVGVESKSNGLKTLQRNKSARYSPSNLDHGLLRFYLTPLRSYRKSESGKSRPSSNNLQSLPKNVL
ncbi:hypothetical protein PRUPE_6G061700 [Prunus persica]|uniref:Uncharacterized protein n=1 Tax=Prunus persica TaxID=3760 RepID=M5WH36_PRUPE|nr:UPF0503 protein At3g09070, chloroplastic [Prunus persica]ONH99997.1 hypothetical protein PRUPE_6G061700 [Prunus persica]